MQSWTVSPTNQVLTHTDGKGEVTTNTYDLRDRLLSQTNGANETQTYEYDRNNNRLRTTLPETSEGNRVWQHTYDAADRLTKIESPMSNETTYTYNVDDQLASINDANHHTVTLTHDALARLTARTYPTTNAGSATFSTQYDGEGNAKIDTKANGHTTTRSFDALNRVRQVMVAGLMAASISTTHNVDANSNITNQTQTIASQQTTIEQSFDNQNRKQNEKLISDAMAGGSYQHQHRQSFDANGNAVSQTDATNTSTQQAFDARNRLISFTNSEGSTTQTWYADDTLASITQPGGVRTDYTYDQAKRITEITHKQNGAITLSFEYNYDHNGNRTQEIKTQAAINGSGAQIQTTHYQYDLDDRLTRTDTTHQPPSANTQTKPSCGR
ncbi:MAG: RHS repeat protein [Brachymonas sp.]|nr:RHS repeat protein [Brachymonas sp.]